MSVSGNRQIDRDSLFLMAEMRIDGVEGEHRVRVRNLSSGGMMAEGGPPAARGAMVWVDLRNIGWVEGTVAWIHESRIGIAFREEIDPKMARAPVASGEAAPRYVRPVGVNPAAAYPGQLRKV
jgi:hypothetical protein